MNKKRLAVFSIVLISAFLLSGCGKKTGSGVDGGTGESMETPGVTTAPTLGADKGKQEETAKNFINFL